MKLMSIAMRPLANPPFPVERIEEMTAMMGGEGELPELYRKPKEDEKAPLKGKSQTVEKAVP